MTQLISNNYEKKTSFVLLKSYQILLNLYQKLMNLYQILMNLYQFLMNLYQIFMNLYQFLTNYVISKKKKKWLFYWKHIKLSSQNDAVESPSPTRKFIAICTCIVLLSMDVFCRVDVDYLLLKCWCGQYIIRAYRLDLEIQREMVVDTIGIRHTTFDII